MAKITVNADRCKGCALCTTSCPKKIVIIDTKTLNKKGYNPAYCIDNSKCTGCALCALMCPDCAIIVEK